MSKVIVTGGTGYIGSHICSLLLEKGYQIIVLDSFVNSSPNVLNSILKINNIKNNFDPRNIKLIKCDMRNESLLNKIFQDNSSNSDPIHAVIHLAGLKSVEDSMISPIKYWDFNVKGTINLVKIMEEYKCYKLVFSSSATIYGPQKNKNLIREDAEINPKNNYGKTKQIIENILFSLNKTFNWKIVSLRYFNPIGAHDSGLIGEDPLLKATNIMPILNKVASRKKKVFDIYGSDWDTYDGTCIRDYIHVMDLAEGHLKALEYLQTDSSESIALNLGTGKGISVLKLVKTFEQTNNIKIPYRFTDKRSGDSSYSVADNTLAKSIIKWEPKYDLNSMCMHSWEWFKSNLN